MPRTPVPGSRGTDAPKQILFNRKLRHDYAVLERWEAGMVLMGSEVKALREGLVQWADAHARLDPGGELWMYGLHIGEYRQAVAFGHQPAQPRKLLLSRRQLDQLAGMLKGKGLTVVPEELLWRRGWAKIVVCLCQGKDKDDKRQDLIARAQKRDVQRELARRARGKG